jgi:hypothetical protein
MSKVFNKSSAFDRLNYDFNCLLVTSTSIKISSSTIKISVPSVRRQDPLAGVNDGGERLLD